MLLDLSNWQGLWGKSASDLELLAVDFGLAETHAHFARDVDNVILEQKQHSAP